MGKSISHKLDDLGARRMQRPEFVACLREMDEQFKQWRLGGGVVLLYSQYERPGYCTVAQNERIISCCALDAGAIDPIIANPRVGIGVKVLALTFGGPRGDEAAPYFIVQAPGSRPDYQTLLCSADEQDTAVYVEGLPGLFPAGRQQIAGRTLPVARLAEGPGMLIESEKTPERFDFEEWKKFTVAKMPELFAFMTEKRYQMPNGYPSPQLYAYSVLSALSDLTLDEREMTAGEAYLLKYIYHSACVGRRNSFPVFLVRNSLVEAARDTELPAGMPWRTMKLPYEAGCLVLPRGSLLAEDGYECPFIYWGRVPVQMMRLAPHLSASKYNRNMTPHESKLIVWSSLFDPKGIKQPQFAMKIFDPTVEFLQLTSENEESINVTSSRHDTFLLEMAKVAFNVLLISEARPRLKSEGRLISKPKKSPVEVWSPIVLGASYETPHSVSANRHAERTPLGGGQEPTQRRERAVSARRPGWRRGHWTHIATGKIKGNAEFVSSATLPRNERGEINWSAVGEEVRDRFWACHERRWLEPVPVGYENDQVEGE